MDNESETFSLQDLTTPHTVAQTSIMTMKMSRSSERAFISRFDDLPAFSKLNPSFQTDHRTYH